MTNSIIKLERNWTVKLPRNFGNIEGQPIYGYYGDTIIGTIKSYCNDLNDPSLYFEFDDGSARVSRIVYLPFLFLEREIMV